MGGYRRVRMEKSVQRATPYILFYPLDMTRVYESFGIIWNFLVNDISYVLDLKIQRCG